MVICASKGVPALPQAARALSRLTIELSQVVAFISRTVTLARSIPSPPQILGGDLTGIAWHNAEDGHVFVAGSHDGIVRALADTRERRCGGSSRVVNRRGET